MIAVRTAALSRDAVCKRRDEAGLDFNDPQFEIGCDLLSDHGMEPVKQGTRFHQQRHTDFVHSDGDAVRFAEMVRNAAMTTKEGKSASANVEDILLSNPDGLREVMRAVMQEVLKAETDEALGAAKGERTPERLGPVPAIASVR